MILLVMTLLPLPLLNANLAVALVLSLVTAQLIRPRPTSLEPDSTEPK